MRDCLYMVYLCAYMYITIYSVPCSKKVYIEQCYGTVLQYTIVIQWLLMFFLPEFRSSALGDISTLEWYSKGNFATEH